MIDSDAIHAAIVSRVVELTAGLKERVKDNLSGAVLQQRSGRLLASITSGIDENGGDVDGFVASVDVPYAAIQEYGGKTAAHDIIAVKAKVMAFFGGTGTVFARRVHHPGSVIPAHAYLGRALDDMRDLLASELKRSVLDALNADQP